MFEEKSYREIVNDILLQLTKGIVKEKHLFEPDRVKYRLENTPVKDIVEIRGIFEGTSIVFEKDRDYRLVNNMVEWIEDGRHPDINTFFQVSYIYGKPSGITDTNPGSVIRTIVESIGREIEYLYLQLKYVYESGYIDTARGSALDLVVALLGITRKPAEYATGTVVFGRNTPPRKINVSNEAYIYDGRNTYAFKKTPVEKVINVSGIVAGKKYKFVFEKDYTYDKYSLTWLKDGLKPDMGSTFYIDYVTYEQIIIEAGTIVSTFATGVEEAKTYITLEDAVLRETEEGRWEAEVPVRATVPGSKGNTYAGSITIMPSPPRGVEYVINRKDITGGVDEESDEELRERAKKALQVAGKATFISLENAVKGVEGVTSVVIEEMVDGVPGIVRIIVDGGDMDEIRRVVDDVRAAGIRVEIERPIPVYVDVEISIDVMEDFDKEDVKRNVREEVLKYLGSLGVGQGIIFAKLMSIIINVNGVKDVIDISLNVFRTRESRMEKIKMKNVEVKMNEKIIPRTITVNLGGK